MLNSFQHLRYNDEIARPNQLDQTATEILNQVQDDRCKYYLFCHCSILYSALGLYCALKDGFFFFRSNQVHSYL